MTQAVIDNTIIVEFRKPTREDGSHNAINVNAPQYHIWAFNPNPNPDSEDGWKDHHGPHRGAAKITYATGASSSVDPDSIYAKRIHGLAMVITWMFLFPASIFYSRYFRSVTGWVSVHLYINGIAAVAGVFGFVIFMVLNISNNFRHHMALDILCRPHSLLGVTLALGIFFQSVLGIFNRLSLSSETFDIDRSRFAFLRFAHHWLGRALVIMSFVQVGLGIEVLYPISEIRFRGRGAWIAYVCVCVMWVLAFVIAEVYFKYLYLNSSSKLVVDRTGKLVLVSSAASSPAAYEKLSTKGIPDAHTQLKVAALNAVDTDLLALTWDDIDNNVRNGNLLVVANGKYVYAINSWIQSHPGGQIILHGVAGTDITNDFFNEAGFDAEAFAAPKDSLAAPSTRTLPDTTAVVLARSNTRDAGRARQSAIREARANSGMPPQFEPATFATLATLDEKEWHNIVRARRTHVHTRLAISKLSSLIVGEVVPSEKSLAARPTADGSPGSQHFDRSEYRRYALVSAVNETPVGTTEPIYRFKFCLLYPFDARVGEPPAFLPGQCIELQVRINGKYVARYYTPTCGNPSSFEILVKIYQSGALTPFLAKQKPGERQFKARGPYGTLLLDPERPLFRSSPEWYFERTIAICGGSGIAPAIQLIQTMLLPLCVPLNVWQGYIAANSDEMTLNPGDWVVARRHYYDGWAMGLNLTTQQEGLFPLPVTVPRVGPSARLAIINAMHSHFDAGGMSIIRGAMLAYPMQFSITHCLSRGLPADVDTAALAQAVPGKIVASRVTEEATAQTLLNVRWQFGESDQRQRIIVCGPQGFDGDVYDLLTGTLQVDHNHIMIMPEYE
nr:hypothetical protein HK105_002560 [Polyrhizophydium stewartii]